MLRQRLGVFAPPCGELTDPDRSAIEERRSMIEDVQKLRRLVSQHIDGVSKSVPVDTVVVFGNDPVAAIDHGGEGDDKRGTTMLCVHLLNLFLANSGSLTLSELVDRLGSEAEKYNFDVFSAMIFLRRRALINRWVDPVVHEPQPATYTITASGRRWIKFQGGSTPMT